MTTETKATVTRVHVPFEGAQTIGRLLDAVHELRRLGAPDTAIVRQEFTLPSDEVLTRQVLTATWERDAIDVAVANVRAVLAKQRDEATS